MLQFSKPKIEWVGEILAKVGYGILTREFLMPVRDEVKLVPKEDYVKPENKYIDGLWAEKVIESMIKPESDVRISFSIPPLYDYIPGKLNIGMSLWDLDTLPQEWVKRMNDMDALLFPTSDMAANAVKSGVTKPVAVFTPHISLSRWLGEIAPLELDTKSDVTFLVDDSWGPNSNLEEVIQAYCIAFDGMRNVTLVIRIDNAESIDQKRNIRGAIQSIPNRMPGLNKPRIVVVDDTMSEEELNSLVKSATYVISGKSSISFDMQTIRSAAIGVPVIATAIPNRDNSLVSFKIQSYSVPMLVSAQFYKYNQFCKKPDVKDFVEKLKYGYNLFMSDRTGYGRLILSKREEACKKHGSTNLLEVCDHLQKEFIKENENRKHRPPSIGLVR